MRRVVVTGLGIVSSIGNDAATVEDSLRQARSGISFSDEFAEHGFKCQVWGRPTLDPAELVDRRDGHGLERLERRHRREVVGDQLCGVAGHRVVSTRSGSTTSSIGSSSSGSTFSGSSPSR